MHISQPILISGPTAHPNCSVAAEKERLGPQRMSTWNMLADAHKFPIQSGSLGVFVRTVHVCVCLFSALSHLLCFLRLSRKKSDKCVTNCSHAYFHWLHCVFAHERAPRQCVCSCSTVRCVSYKRIFSVLYGASLSWISIFITRLSARTHVCAFIASVWMWAWLDGHPALWIRPHVSTMI